MCEEVQHPSTQVPKAMAGTILLNLACGLVFIIPLVFVMPDQEYLANLASGQPLPVIIHNAIGIPGASFALCIPLIVLGIFCGTACTTATSRCTWAFARDGAIPGSKWWKTVNTKLDVPLNAMMLAMVIELALGLIYFGSAAAFNAFSGVGVITLTLSYACPIAVSVMNGRRLIAGGSFNFGTLGLIANVIALCTYFLSAPSSLCPVANSCRLVRSCYPSLLYALDHSRYRRVDELRICRLLRFLRHLNCMVLRLGQEELPGTTHTRSGRVPGKKSQHRGQIGVKTKRCSAATSMHSNREGSSFGVGDTESGRRHRVAYATPHGFFIWVIRFCRVFL